MFKIGLNGQYKIIKLKKNNKNPLCHLRMAKNKKALLSLFQNTCGIGEWKDQYVKES